MSVGIGTGTEVEFSTSMFSGKVLNIELDGEEVPMIDMAHMGSEDYRPKVFGELIEPPQMTVEINYDPSDPPPFNVEDTCTVTWPDGATLSGTGRFISRTSTTPLEDKMTGTYVFRFDGQTGPTYTAGS